MGTDLGYAGWRVSTNFEPNLLFARGHIRLSVGYLMPVR